MARKRKKKYSFPVEKSYNGFGITAKASAPASTSAPVWAGSKRIPPVSNAAGIPTNRVFNPAPAAPPAATPAPKVIPMPIGASQSNPPTTQAEAINSHNELGRGDTNNPSSTIQQADGGYGTVRGENNQPMPTRTVGGYSFQGSAADFKKFARPVSAPGGTVATPVETAPTNEGFNPGPLDTLGDFIKAGARFKVYKANAANDIAGQNAATLGASRENAARLGWENVGINKINAATLGASREAVLNKTNLESASLQDKNQMLSQYYQEQDPAKKEILGQQLTKLGVFKQTQTWKPATINTGEIDKFGAPIKKTVLVNNKGQIKDINLSSGKKITSGQYVRLLKAVNGDVTKAKQLLKENGYNVNNL